MLGNKKILGLGCVLLLAVSACARHVFAPAQEPWMMNEFAAVGQPLTVVWAGKEPIKLQCDVVSPTGQRQKMMVTPQGSCSFVPQQSGPWSIGGNIKNVLPNALVLGDVVPHPRLRDMYEGEKKEEFLLKSRFSRRARIGANGRAKPHTGVDIVAPIGAPLYSVRRGVVTEARREDPFLKPETAQGGGHGLRVQVTCPGLLMGKYDVTFLYAHLSAIPDYIQEGVWVNQGDVVGYAGISGNARNIRGIAKNPEEQHVHVECRISAETAMALGDKLTIKKTFKENGRDEETIYYINPETFMKTKF